MQSRQIGLAAVVMLVALRLTIGWHFFKEGADHIEDPHFSSAPLLSKATGPWADYYHSLAGSDFHRWDELMAQPLKDDPTAEPPSEEETAEGEVPADAPYRAWAEQLAQDWRARLHGYLDHFELTEDQEQAAAEVFERRKQQVFDYLADASDEIRKYRHEIYRLEQMRNSDTAEAVPFQQARIAEKEAELAGEAAAWKSDLRRFEDAYRADLDQVLDLDGQQQQQARSLFRENRLASIDWWTARLIFVVGGCLVVGLGTRIAAVLGAGFLLSVISTQPPWVAGADPVYYQAVEMVALLVLATVGAGRWGGLDYFVHHMYRRCCAAEGSKA